MNLTNLSNQGIVFWRVFDEFDAAYWVGVEEGTLLPGETANYTDAIGAFQLEIKRGIAALGPSLVRPGPVFRNEDWLESRKGGSWGQVLFCACQCAMV